MTITMLGCCLDEGWHTAVSNTKKIPGTPKFRRFQGRRTQNPHIRDSTWIFDLVELVSFGNLFEIQGNEIF
jgi:hypothetical protein